MVGRALVAIVLAGSVAMAQDAKPSQDAPASSQPIKAGIRAGKILHAVPPRYPAAAKAAGISGTVVLTGIVEKDGTLDQVKVVSGPPELQQAAVEAASQWIYSPYLLNGEPTPVTTRLSINFNLTPKATPADPNDPKPLRVSGGVMAGALLKKVMPKGPPNWCLEHNSGVVVYHAIIGKDGKVEELSPLSGSEMMKAYMTDSIRRWTYRPYELNGQPVEVDTTITMSIQWGAPPPDACKAAPASGEKAPASAGGE